MNEQAGDVRELGPLVDEFVELCRLGERPSIADYVQRYPDLAADIRRLFPTLLEMEELVAEVEENVERELANSVPDRIGDYEIIRELGRGGMGIVYEAEQVSLGRRVALKVLPQVSMLDEQRIKRFQREVRAVAQLHHANIVPIFGVGEDDGVHFFAMRYISGSTMADVLEDLRTLRPQETPESVSLTLENKRNDSSLGDDASPGIGNRVSTNANEGAESFWLSRNRSRASTRAGYYRNIARLGVQAADALAYAHSQGIVHRDVKPSNLMLDTQGQLWIADFGLAKVEGDDLTTTGDFVGTLRYMAPERFHGWADPRSDIYSLGLTLYECIALRPAFAETDRAALIRSVSHSHPVPPSKYDRQLPRDLETIILKAIEKEPLTRYESAADLSRDLQRFVDDRPIVARRATWREQVRLWARRNPLVAGLSTLILVMFVFFAAWQSVGNRRLRDQLLETETAEHSSQRNLFVSYMSQVDASATSTAPGRRFRGLEAVEKAVALAPHVNASGTDLAALRKNAIVLLTMFDARPEIVHEVDGHPTSHIKMDFDSRIERYATQCRTTGDVLIRDVVSNDELRRFKGLGQLGAQAPYSHFCFSPDDHYLAARLIADDGRIVMRLWRLQHLSNAHDNAPLIDKEVGGDDFSRDLTFSENGRWFFWSDYVDGKPCLHMTDLPTMEDKLIDENSLFVAMHPNRQRIAVDDSYQVSVCSIDDVSNKLAFHHSTPAMDSDWSPDGQQLATACGDRRGYIWHADDNSSPMTILRGHNSKVIFIRYHPTESIVTTWSWDCTSRFWDPNTGDELLSIPHFSRKFSEDGKHLGVERAGDTVGRYEIACTNVCRTLSLGSGIASVASISISDDNRLIAAASWDGLKIWHADTGRLAQALPNCGSTVDFLPSSYDLITCAQDQYVRVPIVRKSENTTAFRAGTPQRMVAIDDPAYRFGDLGNGLFVGSGSLSELVVLRLSQPEMSIRCSGLNAPFLPSLSPDGKYIAAGAKHDFGLKIWDAHTGQEITGLHLEYAGLSGRFSPDGRWLAVAMNGAYVIHDTTNWQVIRRIERNDGGRGRIAFRDDMSMLAVSEKYSVRLIDPFNNWQELAELQCARRKQISADTAEGAGDICFSPDGTKLAVGTREMSVTLWDLDLLQSELEQLGLSW